MKYNRSKVEGRKREIQATSDALEARNSPLDGTLSVGKRVTSLTPVGPRRTATTSTSGSGTSLALHPQTLCGIPIIPHFSTGPPACGRLITRAFALHKRPLIEAMISGRDEGDAIRCLLGDDPQTFIDVIGEASFTLVDHCGSVN